MSATAHFPLLLDRPSPSTATGVPPARKQRDHQRFFLLTAALALVVIIAILVLVQLARYRTDERWVRHTFEVIATAEHLTADIDSAENNVRTYALTGDGSYLGLYLRSASETINSYKQLQTLTIDNQRQQQRLAKLRRFLDERLAMMERLAALRTQTGVDVDLRVLRQSSGPALTQYLKSHIDDAKSEERRLLAARLGDAGRTEKQTAIGVLSGTGLLFSLLAFATVMIAHDTRRREAAEEELRALAASLEQHVAERTQALEEANRELEAYTLTVSHDLRAPLRTLQGLSRALLEDYGHKLEQEGRLYAQLISEAGERLDRLIQDLLEYSRLSRSELHLQPVPLRGVVRTAIEQQKNQIESTGAIVEVNQQMPEVIGHVGTLNQVFSNLLGNALKFVRSGTVPHIKIWTEQQGKCVRTYMQDNGIGIDPAQQERVFDLFQRLHGPETYPGTGIGLSIVRKGVERLRGRVGVTSTPGQGSLFWVDLPPVTESIETPEADPNA